MTAPSSSYAKANTRLHFHRHFKRSTASPDDLFSVASIRSVLEYACQIWSTSLTVQQCDLVDSIQRRALMIIYPALHYDEALAGAALPTLKELRLQMCLSLFTQLQRNTHKLHHLLPEKRTIAYGLGNARPVAMPKNKK